MQSEDGLLAPVLAGRFVEMDPFVFGARREFNFPYLAQLAGMFVGIC